MMHAQPSPRSPQPVGVPALPLAPIPEALRHSPLFLAGGVAVLPDFPGLELTARLRQEALAAYVEATAQECFEPHHGEGRGGTPPRKLLTASGGAAQDAFYAAPELARALASQVGLPVHPSGNRGSYSYYVRSGDFLDLHRDIETCDLTLITALHNHLMDGGASGALVVYPERREEPLSAIRATPYDGAYTVALEPGQSALLLGGIVPHRVLPVAEGQLRIVSVLCFEVACS